MKIPIGWLKDYIEVKDEQALIDSLTAIGHMQDGPPKEGALGNVYDLEIRQNRPDCLSIVGIAREAAAARGDKLNKPHAKPQPLSEMSGGYTVTIKDSSQCYRFNTLVLENIKVGESPQFIKERLEAYGIKVVNNVVDITNFVMVELGQPLHAFDLAKMGKQSVVIRSASKGEELEVLGAQTVKLTEEDLLVATEESAIAVAGIIGGAGTAVDDSTTSILLEAATYNQAYIRRTSRRLQLRTEASTRHEKFLHPKLTEIALTRAVELLVKHAGAKVANHIDTYPHPKKEPTIALHISKIKTLGGVSLKKSEIEKILEDLFIAARPGDGDLLEVTPAYFRTDLAIEEDIIEEVIRIHGYEHIPATLPHQPPPPSLEGSEITKEEAVRDLMVEAGYDEQITEPLVEKNETQRDPVVLQNSLNSDKTMLRTSLKASLAGCIKNQQKYGKKIIQLFEVGKIYYKEGAGYKEQKMLGVATAAVRYRDIKGVLELVAAHFEGSEIITTPIETLNVSGGFFFELPLDALKAQIVQKPLAAPPQVVREDLSFEVAKSTPVGEFVAAAKDASAHVRTVKLGEEPRLHGNHKTLFLHIEFSSPDKTLTKEEASTLKDKIISRLASEFDAKVRA